MKIVLLGATGYVGSVFQDLLREREHEVNLISRSNCDLYSDNSLRNRLASIQPDYLINCAGYTGKPNVDACESSKTDCLLGNTALPGILGEACIELDIPWGHVSSGCIYTGRRCDGNGFRETDPPNFSFRFNNCSFYSGTKALGEEILSSFSNCHIWRLRIPFNNLARPRNYLFKLMSYERLLDVENSLSNLDEFAMAAIECMEKNLPFGTYNLTNPGSVTTRQVVDVLKGYKLIDRKVAFFNSENEFMQSAAIAPRSSCVLDSSLAVSRGLRLTPVMDAIHSACSTWCA